MSLNLFRSKMKKKSKTGYVGHEKKNSDPIAGVVVSSGSYSGGGAGAGSSHAPSMAKEVKRKAVSVSSPPEIPSPVHQVKNIESTLLEAFVVS